MATIDSSQELVHSQSRFLQTDSPEKVSTEKLEAALAKASKRALEYECQMRDLEARLSESLSNFRAIDSLIQESYTSIQRHTKRAERALQNQVPHINGELKESLRILSDLEESLPKIRSRVARIHVVYDSGRAKAKTLVKDLTWLNTDFYERWRLIIFASSSPVSWRWKAIMRSLFALSFVACACFFWILLSGAYRAHRHRLVWGERLLS